MSRGGRGGKRRGDAMTFSLESIGFNRGESLPPPVLTPPANYPTIDREPLPLHNEDVDNYWLTLKQEMRQSLMTSKDHINAAKDKPKIERYSDKYENIVNDMNVNDNLPIDWRLFPIELWPKSKRTKNTQLKSKIRSTVKSIDDLEENDNENNSDSESSDKEVDENGSEADKLEEDVEDPEEITDYTNSYFDNGEDYLDESDDNADEGPTY